MQECAVVRCGVLCHAAGAALKIFEGLEMWDQLIVCYRLLDKKQVAQELVLTRLKVLTAISCVPCLSWLLCEVLPGCADHVTTHDLFEDVRFCWAVTCSQCMHGSFLG